MPAQPTPTDEMQELISQLIANQTPVEVFKITNPSIETLYLSAVVPTGTKLKDENGDLYTVYQVPMKATESAGNGMTNSRTISIVALNDIIAKEVAKIDKPRKAEIKVELYAYILDENNVLSDITLGPLTHYLQRLSYTEKGNGVNLTISTSPTNRDETGRRVTREVFRGIEAFE